MYPMRRINPFDKLCFCVIFYYNLEHVASLILTPADSVEAVAMHHILQTGRFLLGNAGMTVSVSNGTKPSFLLLHLHSRFSSIYDLSCRPGAGVAQELP